MPAVPSPPATRHKDPPIPARPPPPGPRPGPRVLLVGHVCSDPPQVRPIRPHVHFAIVPLAMRPSCVQMSLKLSRIRLRSAVDNCCVHQVLLNDCRQSHIHSSLPYTTQSARPRVFRSHYAMHHILPIDSTYHKNQIAAPCE